MMIDVASVAMKALTRPSVISRPLPSPQARPTSAPTTNDPQVPTPVCRKALPHMIAENPETAPTDRSNPPAMKTSVPPAAMIPTGVAWNARFFMFAEVRNALLDSESVMNSAMNASTTP